MEKKLVLMIHGEMGMLVMFVCGLEDILSVYGISNEDYLLM